MRNTHPLEEDIRRVLASIHADASREEERPADEPIETYHLYPMHGGIFITKEEKTGVVDTNPPQTTQPPLLSFFMAIFCSLLLIILLVFVSTFPTTKQLTLIRSVTLPVHLLLPVIKSGSETIVATGRGHQNATVAHGNITLYNGSFSEQVIPQNMLFTASNGIQIATDQGVTIPAGNPPNYGQATISAHAIFAGSEGNIPAYSINTICCATAVKAVNTEAFSGGRNAREYHVVTQKDIDNGVTLLKQAVFQQAQAALQQHLTADQVYISLPCSPRVKTTHTVGEEANTVTVTVSTTCSGVTYSHKSLENTARHVLPMSAGFTLLSFKVHIIDTTISTDHNSVTVTVATIAILCYQQHYRPPVK